MEEHSVKFFLFVCSYDIKCKKKKIASHSMWTDMIVRN